MSRESAAHESFFSHLSYRYQSRRPQNVTFIVLWAKFVQNANTTLLPAAVPGLGVYTRDWQPFTPIRREYCLMTERVMYGRGYFFRRTRRIEWTLSLMED